MGGIGQTRHKGQIGRTGRIGQKGRMSVNRPISTRNVHSRTNRTFSQGEKSRSGLEKVRLPLPTVQKVTRGQPTQP